MTNVFPMKNAKDWKYYDQQLTELRVNDVENIIKRGKLLIEAKEELEHGSFEATVKRHMSADTAQMLMAIARNPILTKTDHGRLLPPSWRTLYELTKLDNDVLIASIKDGTINPKMERKDVMNLRQKRDNPKRDEAKAAIKANPTAPQKEAAKALGIGLSTYKTYKKELVDAGEINPANPSKPPMKDSQVYDVPDQEIDDIVKLFNQRFGDLRQCHKEDVMAKMIRRLRIAASGVGLRDDKWRRLQGLVTDVVFTNNPRSK